MADRIFAILRDTEGMDGNVADLVSRLSAFGRVDVYSRTPAEGETAVPPGADTEPKMRNWINGLYSSNGFTGFLHVVKDDVRLKSDPAAFLSDVERMMKAFDYGVWLNTACDGMNYVYSKYNPSISIRLDVDEVAKAVGLGCDVCVTTHSNTQWMCYDFEQVAGSDLLRFDEDFTVPMFFIIEFLARRRASRPAGALYFMNQYLTVGSERGVFGNIEHPAPKTPKETVEKEDAIFKSKNVRYEPDYDVDALMEAIWEKMKSKMPRT